METILFEILMVGLFLVFIALIITPVLIQNKFIKNKEWAGVLEKKKILINYKNPKNKNYMLTFRNDLGKRVVCEVSEATYNSLNIGERAKKSKGQYDPVRIL